MSIRVELFGIPRDRAGVAETTAEGPDLAGVLADLAVRFPGLAESCFDGPHLRPGYVANVNGDQFVSDPHTLLRAGDALLILSADAGG